MTIEDFSQTSTLGDGQFDVAIIGAGAAGITLALELEKSGFSVCLLEGGDEAPNPEAQALYDMEYTGYPHRENYHPRVRVLGGSTSIWAGRSMLLQPTDFTRDWPIGPSEIEPYLDAAANYLELPSLDSFTIDSHHGRVTAAEKALIDSDDLAPALSTWAVKPQRFSRRFRRALERSQNVALVINANVTRLMTNQEGTSLDKIEIRALNGNQATLRAKTYVLACGGIETARVLLASPGKSGNGIGNGSDHVGRYFMDHPRAVHGRAIVKPSAKLNLARGLPIAHGKVQLGFRFSDDKIRRDGLLNHYCTFEEEASGYVQQTYQPFVEVMKVVMRKGHAGSRLNLAKAFKTKATEGFVYLLSPKEILPHWAYRLLTAARRAIPQKPREKRYAIVYFCEQPPEAESRISLSQELDAIGVPRVRFNWHIPETTEDHIRALEASLDIAMRKNGIGEIIKGEGPVSYVDASHHLGTARMSTKAEDGVVDRHCRVHEIDNLFIAGSAVFPTGGHANPTLTLLALTLRLADFLKARTI